MLGQPQQGPLTKLVAFVLSVGFMILAFMFSLVALAVVAVIGIGLGGWLWWRTRKLRAEINRQRAEQTWPGTPGAKPFRPAAEQPATVIEGEATRVADDTAGSTARRMEH